MDVTEPNSPQEVVSGILHDYLTQTGIGFGDDEELDTDDLADNVVIALRQAGFLPDEDHAEDLRTAAKAHGIFTGEMPHVVCTHPLNTPCPAPSGFHREANQRFMAEPAAEPEWSAFNDKNNP